MDDEQLVVNLPALTTTHLRLVRAGAKYVLCFKLANGNTFRGEQIYTREEIDNIVAEANDQFPAIEHWAEEQKEGQA